MLARFLLCLILALAAGAGRAAPGLAAADKGLTLSSIKLKGSHGYEIAAVFAPEGFGKPVAGISVERQELHASYAVPADPGPGVDAGFGSLGRFKGAFHRRKRAVERFGKHCTVIVEKGLFRGHLEFTGEGGYTSVKRSSAGFETIRLPNGFCFFGDDRRAPGMPGFPQATTLVASARTTNGSVSVSASEPRGTPGVDLSVSVQEQVGPMKITRSASVGPEKGLLALGSGKHPHSADLRGSSPFQGSAHLQDPVDGPPTWTGSLNVSLPGAPAVSLTGPAFHVKICVDQSLLQSCEVNLPAGPGHPEPEL